MRFFSDEDAVISLASSPPGPAGPPRTPGSTGNSSQLWVPGSVTLCVGWDGAEGEAVQQLREALKILAERVLILEHMIGIHDTTLSLEPGSGGGTLPSAVKVKREGGQRHHLLSTLLSGQDHREPGRPRVPV
uniref:Uncharacterized protein n=1 Tax=Callorhinchus milii TaxID=7868 RepID=A0A4W3IMN5_CALMI